MRRASGSRSDTRSARTERNGRWVPAGVFPVLLPGGGSKLTGGRWPFAFLSSNCAGKIERLGRRAIRARHPEGAAQAVGAGRGPGHGQPLAVDLVGLVGVDEDVAVTILAS